MKPSIPMSMRQLSSVGRFQDMDDLSEWIDNFLDVHDGKGNPYYLHIDHLQILPDPGGKGYEALAIYHTIYLKKGE